MKKLIKLSLLILIISLGITLNGCFNSDDYKADISFDSQPIPTSIATLSVENLTHISNNKVRFEIFLNNMTNVVNDKILNDFVTYIQVPSSSNINKVEMGILEPDGFTDPNGFGESNSVIEDGTKWYEYTISRNRVVPVVTSLNIDSSKLTNGKVKIYDMRITSDEEITTQIELPYYAEIKFDNDYLEKVYDSTIVITPEEILPETWIDSVTVRSTTPSGSYYSGANLDIDVKFTGDVSISGTTSYFEFNTGSTNNRCSNPYQVSLNTYSCNFNITEQMKTPYQSFLNLVNAYGFIDNNLNGVVGTSINTNIYPTKSIIINPFHVKSITGTSQASTYYPGDTIYGIKINVSDTFTTNSPTVAFNNGGSCNLDANLQCDYTVQNGQTTNALVVQTLSGISTPSNELLSGYIVSNLNDNKIYRIEPTPPPPVILGKIFEDTDGDEAYSTSGNERLIQNVILTLKESDGTFITSTLVSHGEYIFENSNIVSGDNYYFVVEPKVETSPNRQYSNRNRYNFTATTNGKVNINVPVLTANLNRPQTPAQEINIEDMMMLRTDEIWNKTSHNKGDLDYNNETEIEDMFIIRLEKHWGFEWSIN